VGLRDASKTLLSLAEALYRWTGALAGLDGVRREKVAGFAAAIADTLARLAESLLQLEQNPEDSAAKRQAVRDFGRIAGYLETLVGVLQHHLDGRKLAGVKRRLESLSPGLEAVIATAGLAGAKVSAERIIAAEGYFRALADSLRA
jgi:hypothetical protein